MVDLLRVRESFLIVLLFHVSISLCALLRNEGEEPENGILFNWDLFKSFHGEDFHLCFGRYDLEELDTLQIRAQFVTDFLARFPRGSAQIGWAKGGSV